MYTSVAELVLVRAPAAVPVRARTPAQALRRVGRAFLRFRRAHAEDVPGGVPRNVRRAPRGAVRGAAVDVLDAGVQFCAAGCGAFAVVMGPGQVQADGVGLLLRGGGLQPAGQFGGAFGGVALLAEHDVEPVAQGVTAAGPGVVRGERGAVQGTGPLGLLGRRGGTVRGAEVVHERLDDVPGRHLQAVQAGPHAVGVALPENGAPATALVELRHQSVQVSRELPYLSRELIQSHRILPGRLECSGPQENTSCVTGRLREVFVADAVCCTRPCDSCA